MADNIQEERLKNYLEAEKKTLLSQEYQEGSKRNRRANLNQISDGINELMAGGAGINHQPGGRSRRVIFRD
ncbi:DUF6148 family protein [Anaerospora hongkongensis]|uniref:DUF6148 family protein n=1 Tax=Anaerospora hongkongensis TaxID=244830 RepID=UPI002FD9FEFC